MHGVTVKENGKLALATTLEPTSTEPRFYLHSTSRARWNTQIPSGIVYSTRGPRPIYRCSCGPFKTAMPSQPARSEPRYLCTHSAPPRPQFAPPTRSLTCSPAARNRSPNPRDDSVPDGNSNRLPTFRDAPKKATNELGSVVRHGRW